MTRLRKFAGIFRNLNQTLPPEPVVAQALLPSIETIEFHGRLLPRHVPFGASGRDETAYRHFVPGELIMSHRETIDQILDDFTGTDLIPGFDGLIIDALNNFGAYTSSLPGSRQHHHPNPGGLFAHSLDVAHKALILSSSYNLSHKSAPMEREASTLAWELVVFFCGLLHDIGKVHSLGKVMARTVVIRDEEGRARHDIRPTHPIIWRPNVCSLDEWVRRFDVDSFAIDFIATPGQANPQRHERAIDRYFHQLVPQPLLSFIFEADNEVLDLLDAFLVDPMGSAQTALNGSIKDADAFSLVESMSPRTSPGSITLSGMAIRRIKEFANTEGWNFPGSAFLRAHIVLDDETADRTVAAQMSFFVATPDNIDKFVSFFDRKEQGSIPLWGPARSDAQTISSILGALESAGVLLREIPAILPKQKPEPGQAKENPASMAYVLFSPRDPSELSEGMKFKPLQVRLPLVALCSTITPPTRLSMPTISFWGPPKSPFSISTPVRVEGGQLKPENSTQDRDPAERELVDAVSERGKRNVRRLSNPEQLDLLDRQVSMSGGLGPFKQAKIEIAAEGGPSDEAGQEPKSALDAAVDGMTPTPEALGEAQALRSTARQQIKRSVSAAAAADPVMEPVSSSHPGEAVKTPDLWTTAWTAPGTDVSCLISALFLHALENNGASVVDGEYLLDLSYITSKQREIFKGDLKARGMDAARLVLWSREKGIDAAALAQVVSLADGAEQCALRGSAASIVRDILEERA